jgi:hypothetical protein
LQLDFRWGQKSRLENALDQALLLETIIVFTGKNQNSSILLLWKQQAMLSTKESYLKSMRNIQYSEKL